MCREEREKVSGLGALLLQSLSAAKEYKSSRTGASCGFIIQMRGKFTSIRTKNGGWKSLENYNAHREAKAKELQCNGYMLSEAEILAGNERQNIREVKAALPRTRAGSSDDAND